MPTDPRRVRVKADVPKYSKATPPAPVLSRFLSLSRLPQVRQRTGLSRAAVYQQIALGKFPAQVSLGGRSVAWIDAEIDEWISERIIVSRGSAQ